MCQGRCVYHGLPDNVVSHFTTHGYEYEMHDNPADYALDTLIDVVQKPTVLTKLNEEYTLEYTNDPSKCPSIDGNIERERRKLKVEAARCWKAELRYLSQRTIRNAIRNPALASAQVLVSIVMGLLVGCVFNDIEKTSPIGVKNRQAAIFLMIVSQIFCNLTAIEPLIQERALFIHVRTIKAC